MVNQDERSAGTVELPCVEIGQQFLRKLLSCNGRINGNEPLGLRTDCHEARALAVKSDDSAGVTFGSQSMQISDGDGWIAYWLRRWFGGRRRSSLARGCSSSGRCAVLCG